MNKDKDFSSIGNKYSRELRAYTFPKDKYDCIVNKDVGADNILGETFNKCVFASTQKDLYMFNDKIIYYDSLRIVNDRLNLFISLFDIHVKYSNSASEIYSYYCNTLDKIKLEIKKYAESCSKKYSLNLMISDSFFSSTLVEIYMSILRGRRLKINEILRKIIVFETDFEITNYGSNLIELRDYYSALILSKENDDNQLYDDFRNEVRRLLNNRNTENEEKESEEDGIRIRRYKRDSI